MMLTKARAALFGGLALTAVIATAGLAAEPPAGPPGRDGMMMRHMDDPAAQARRAERHAQHLRDALQLRPDQEPALRAFIESMKPPPGAMGGMMGHMGPGPDGDHDGDHDGDENLTTPQRLDRMLAHLDQARAMMVAHAEAVKRFYAALSPTQQKAFDAMGPMGGMHMRMMMHMGHGGMGHDMGEMDGDGERRVIIMRHGGEGGPPMPPPPPGQ
jgi:protein CpxP